MQHFFTGVHTGPKRGEGFGVTSGHSASNTNTLFSDCDLINCTSLTALSICVDSTHAYVAQSQTEPIHMYADVS